MERAHVVFCFCFLLLPAFGQNRLPFKRFTTADGLLSNNGNFDILIDSSDFVWIACRYGISRFDGTQFRQYTAADGLGSSKINSFLQRQNGELLVATNGEGVAQYQPEAGPHERFVRFLVGETPGSNRVNRLREDGAGGLWAATDGGLYRGVKDKKNWRFSLAFQPPTAGRTFSSAFDAATEDVLPCADGSVWVVATEYGLFRLNPDGSWDGWGVSSGLPERYLQHLFRDSRERLWLTSGDGVFLLNSLASGQQGVIQCRWTTANGLPDNESDRAVETPDGHLWFSTRSGLAEFDGVAMRPHRLGEGALTNTLTGLTTDRGGNLWAGLVAGGVLRVLRSGAEYVETPGWPGRHRICGLQTGRAGQITILRSENGLLHAEQQRNGLWVPLMSPARPQIDDWGVPDWRCALEDRRGNFWIALRAGLSVYRYGRRRHIVGKGKELGHGNIAALYEDRQGRLWAGLVGPPRSGLAQIDPVSGAVRIVDDFPANRSPVAFVEDARGVLWIGVLEGGLYRYDNHQFTYVPPPLEARGLGSAILVQDRAGQVWQGYWKGVLARVEGRETFQPRLQVVGLNPPLRSEILVLEGSSEGTLYAGTRDGLFRIDLKTHRSFHFFEEQDLKTALVSNMVGCRGPGLLAVVDGELMQLDRPRQSAHDRPVIWVEQLRVAGQQERLSDRGQRSVTLRPLDYRENRIEAHFGARSLIGPLQYRFRLLPGDKEWSPSTEDATVFLPSLAPGAYHLLAQALDVEGRWSAEPAFLQFQIDPPVWRRLWFRALALLGTALAGRLLYSWRIRQLLAAERLRLRIAEDLHDDLGSSLSQIAVLSTVARQHIRNQDSHGEGALARIGELAREAAISLTDIVWSLDPQRDSAQDLFARLRLFGNDLFSTRQIHFVVHAPEHLDEIRLPLAVRREILLVAKEAMHNVARHAKAKEVAVTVHITRKTMQVEIRDDGRGFALASTSATGHGLGSMQKRARQAGGSLTIESRPGYGTRVQLCVPLDHR